MAAAERPVYLQLRDRIAEAILEGRYREGEMLPSVRAFASEQGANPLTVAKAYQLFQEEGLIIVRRGVGMFVADGAKAGLLERERRAFLDQEWPRIRGTIERLRIDPTDLFARA
jgi:GntR family transcriptional regulator